MSAMMKTIMAAKSSHEASLSFSRRHFQQIIRKVTGEDDHEVVEDSHEKKSKNKKKKNKNTSKIAKLRMAFTSAIGIRRHRPMKMFVGTLFGHRRGHLHFAFQTDPKSVPVLLIELAMPTANLVREMASGLVRIALECDTSNNSDGDSNNRGRKQRSVSEESHWRGYCNGKKCGFATRRECGEKEWRVLRAVEPVTMGAGVLPGGGAHDQQLVVGEMMYMRARFERVVGSRDSEAFYMMNPDGNSGTELSLYLLRV